MKNAYIQNNKAYIYAKQSIKSKEVPKYVKKQCKKFVEIADGKDKKYCINEDKVKQIENVLKLLIMPKGLKAGQTLYECTTNYQWLFYISILAVVYREDKARRRYETGILEICRKNFKTYTVGTLFLLLFLLEPRFSKFYSVAPDGTLSREVKEAISETLKASPLVYMHRDEPRFKILRDYILFEGLENKYTPLNYSNSTLDGKLPACYCVDETGALPNHYAIEAMRSGQLNILNKLGYIISTKYPTINNPFEDEVAYGKKVLDGVIKDDSYFCLLYEPDNPKDWMTDDNVLLQANPVAINNPEIFEDLKKKRARAIAIESARENFVTKHCNIIYSGAGTETYIDVAAVQECKVTSIEWEGKVVYIGLDLSESGDNTSVSILAVDENNNILADSYAFIPEGRIDEKTASERVNYRELIATGKVIACGDKVIDYRVVEEFIINIPAMLGVEIQAVGYDRWNALSTAQKLEAKGITTVEIRQHSSILHPPTKLLKEKILEKAFAYTENKLYEINFLNARCTYDTNKNLYVNKKRSAGKVDMVVSTLNAMYLLQQDFFFGAGDGFVVQVG